MDIKVNDVMIKAHAEEPLICRKLVNAKDFTQVKDSIHIAVQKVLQLSRFCRAIKSDIGIETFD